MKQYSDTEKERLRLIREVHEAIINDPEWQKIIKEANDEIKKIEEQRDTKYREIRNRYWKKYGIRPLKSIEP